MRILRISLLLIACSTALLAANEPLHLADGRILENWQIISETATTVTIKYKAGGAKVEKRLLPEALQKVYAINTVAASNETRENAEGRVAYDTQVKTQAEKRTKENDAFLAKVKAAQERQAAERDLAIATAAKATRGNYVPRQPTSSAPVAGATLAGPSMDEIRAAAVSRADTYFCFERQPASPTLALHVKIDTQKPEPMDGWPGEYHVRGVGYLSYYDSRGSFSSATENFVVTVKTEDQSARASDFRLTIP